MPPEVKAELERLAEQNRRSLNAEIVVRLEQSIKMEGKNCISIDDMQEILSDELQSLYTALTGSGFRHYSNIAENIKENPRQK